MNGYLKNRETLAVVIQLVDSRHIPTELDVKMTQLLQKAGRPFLVAATKRDKLSNNQWQQMKGRILKKLDIAEEQLYPVSAMDKNSIFALRDAIIE